jgi:hypothetical protein
VVRVALRSHVLREERGCALSRYPVAPRPKGIAPQNDPFVTGSDGRGQGKLVVDVADRIGRPGHERERRRSSGFVGDEGGEVLVRAPRQDAFRVRLRDQAPRRVIRVRRRVRVLCRSVLVGSCGTIPLAFRAVRGLPSAAERARSLKRSTIAMRS